MAAAPRGDSDSSSSSEEGRRVSQELQQWQRDRGPGSDSGGGGGGERDSSGAAGGGVGPLPHPHLPRVLVRAASSLAVSLPPPSGAAEGGVVRSRSGHSQSRSRSPSRSPLPGGSPSKGHHHNQEQQQQQLLAGLEGEYNPGQHQRRASTDEEDSVGVTDGMPLHHSRKGGGAAASPGGGPSPNSEAGGGSGSRPRGPPRSGSTSGGAGSGGGWSQEAVADLEAGSGEGMASGGSRPPSWNGVGELAGASSVGRGGRRDRALMWIVLWFIFSMALSMYNKLLLGNKHGHFPAPLLMTTIHFLMQWTIASALLKWVLPTWGAGSGVQWQDYFQKVLPTALATAMDIGVSNLSLAFISLTFYTMCKSSAPVFLLVFAFLFRLETPSLKLAAIMTIISIGVLLAVKGESDFEWLGFILVMVGAIMSGVRWVLVQVLLQKEKLGMTNPLVTLYYLTPIMSLACGAFSLLLESWHKLAGTPYFNTGHHTLQSIALMLLGGSLAFVMIMTEFFLISETSALTFAVAGTVKEGLTILVSHFVFRDAFTMANMAGLVIIVIGVTLFNLYKLQKAKVAKGHVPERSEQEEAGAPLLDGRDTWSDGGPSDGGGAASAAAPQVASCVELQRASPRSQGDGYVAQQESAVAGGGPVDEPSASFLSPRAGGSPPRRGSTNSSQGPPSSQLVGAPPPTVHEGLLKRSREAFALGDGG